MEKTDFRDSLRRVLLREYAKNKEGIEELLDSLDFSEEEQEIENNGIQSEVQADNKKEK